MEIKIDTLDSRPVQTVRFAHRDGLNQRLVSVPIGSDTA